MTDEQMDAIADAHRWDTREGRRQIIRDALATQHPSQSAGEPVAYLDIGVGGYLDLGSDLTDEQLSALPKGRHMLGIIGTYGADGYAPSPPPTTAQQEAGEPVGVVHEMWSAADGTTSAQAELYAPLPAGTKLAASPPPTDAARVEADRREPMTKQQRDAMFAEVQRRANQLMDDGRYSFGGWFPIAVELIEAHYGIRPAGGEQS